MLPSPSAEVGATVDGALAFSPFPESTPIRTSQLPARILGRTLDETRHNFGLCVPPPPHQGKTLRRRNSLPCSASEHMFWTQPANQVLQSSPTAGAGSVHYVSTQFSRENKGRRRSADPAAFFISAADVAISRRGGRGVLRACKEKLPEQLGGTKDADQRSDINQLGRCFALEFSQATLKRRAWLHGSSQLPGTADREASR
ncbi:hypothetical protein ABIB68_006432 [Bradyrhizobium sp. F1.2.2]